MKLITGCRAEKCCLIFKNHWQSVGMSQSFPGNYSVFFTIKLICIFKYIDSISFIFYSFLWINIDFSIFIGNYRILQEKGGYL